VDCAARCLDIACPCGPYSGRSSSWRRLRRRCSLQRGMDRGPDWFVESHEDRFDGGSELPYATPHYRWYSRWYRSSRDDFLVSLPNCLTKLADLLLSIHLPRRPRKYILDWPFRHRGHHRGDDTPAERDAAYGRGDTLGECRPRCW